MMPPTPFLGMPLHASHFKEPTSACTGRQLTPVQTSTEFTKKNLSMSNKFEKDGVYNVLFKSFSIHIYM